MRIVSKKIFFEVVKNKNFVSQLRLKNIFYLSLVFVVMLLIFLLFFYSDWKSNLTLNTFQQFFFRIFQLFYYQSNSSFFLNSNLWIVSFLLVFQEIKYSLLATTIGFLLAFFTSLWSWKQISGRIFGSFCRLLNIILRALPTPIIISSFTLSFASQWALVFSLSWFSWLYLNKYLVEIYENTAKLHFLQLLETTQSRFYAFTHAFFPHIKQRLFFLFLYTFEANLKWTTILAGFGVIGIGGLIVHALTFSNFWELSIPFTVLVGFLLCLETVFWYLKYELVTPPVHAIKKEVFSLDSIVQKRNFKSFFKTLFFLLYLAALIYFFFSLESFNFELNNFVSYWQRLLHPVGELFWTPDTNRNAFFLVLKLLQQLLQILVLSLLFGCIFGVLMSKTLVSRPLFYFVNFFNLLFRLAPSFFIFMLVSPFLWNLTSAAVVAFSFISATRVARQIAQAIEGLNAEHVLLLKEQACSKFRILLTFVFPSIRREVIGFLTFEAELILFALIFLGGYGVSLLGGVLSVHLARDRISHFASYVWVLVLLVILIDYTGLLINSYTQKKFSFKRF